MKLNINLSDKERLRIKEFERKQKLLKLAAQLQTILDNSSFDTDNNVYTIMIKNNKILTISD